MSTDYNVSERVAAGVAYLDEQAPGWRDRVNLDRLRMSHCEDCILGQIYGDYWDAPIFREEDGNGFAVTIGVDASMGLGMSEEFAALGAEWRRVLTEQVPA